GGGGGVGRGVGGGVGGAWPTRPAGGGAPPGGGLGAAPPVGSTRTVSSIVTLFGHRRQLGRWRLPGALRVRAFFGDVHIDLREVIVNDEVAEISAITVLGNLCVDVPEGA